MTASGQTQETRTYAVDIRGLITNSLVEWEGRVAAVVFTAGCNWRCPYCHGWRFVTEANTLKPFDPQAVFDLLKDQGGWLDGVVISGGEPTLQPGLIDFVRDLKATGTAVKLETNGTGPAVLRQLLDENLLDCVALDYKAPLDERLQKVTCVNESATDVEAVRESYALVAETDEIEREYHTTLCPRHIDEDIIDEMGRALTPGGLWVLQQYEPDDILNAEQAGEERFDVAELEAIERVAVRQYDRVLLRKGRGA